MRSTGHRWAALMVAAILMMLAAGIEASAQTFTTLASFNGIDGGYPIGEPLVQGADGNLWGATTQGGRYNLGTIFKVSTAGILSAVYNFTSAPSAGIDVAGMALGTDGNFYGTVDWGGTGGYGNVFKLTPGGAYTVLASFDGTNGVQPGTTLTQGTDGQFYATTPWGGSFFSGPDSLGYGTVFKIDTSGVLTTLHSFDDTDGEAPFAQLVQGLDGEFYGAASGGGAKRAGNIFKISPAGDFSVVYEFSGLFSGGITAGLVQGRDGSFYGADSTGGPKGYGTVFRITPSGVLTTLADFDFTNGNNPVGLLVLATDGNFYGATWYGGAYREGNLYRMTPAGTITNLHSFGPGEGLRPIGLMQATDGKFYGETEFGPLRGVGTLFSMDMGLAPFVKLLPAISAAGKGIGILGYGLTGTTSVTFNGTPAPFTMVSDTFVTATVPTGATTGPVQVVTPSGTLTSNLNFRVE